MKWDKAQPMTASTLLFEDHDVVPAIVGMELDRDRLIEVARYADSERALCTSNDARGFDLIITHDKVARWLREMFCGERREKDELDNQPGIRNPFLKIRIIPCNLYELGRAWRRERW